MTILFTEIHWVLSHLRYLKNFNRTGGIALGAEHKTDQREMSSRSVHVCDMVGFEFDSNELMNMTFGLECYPRETSLLEAFMSQ